MESLFSQYWAQLTTLFVLGGSIVRSEIRGRHALAKAYAIEKAYILSDEKLEDRMKEQRTEDREQSRRDLAHIRSSLDTLGVDIKTLLQQRSK